jgi:hypothetical protein
MEPSSLRILMEGIAILIAFNWLGGLFKPRRGRGRSRSKGFGPPKARKRYTKRIN